MSAAAPELAFGGRGDDPLLGALQVILELHGIRRSREALRSGLPGTGPLTPGTFLRAARASGCDASRVQRALADIPDLVLPVVLELQGGGAVVLVSREAGGRCTLAWPETGAAARQTVEAGALEAACSGYAWYLKPVPGPDRRSGLERAPAGHWLWSTLWSHRGYYAETIVAAVLANVLALAGTFFIMNVYDRVIVNEAYVTLWTLAVGVLVAIGFEFTARCLRGWLIDQAGRKADLVIGSRLFAQALGMRLERRPESAGAFASQLREFESLRDFASSLTLVTLTDLPFLLLFLLVIAFIAGPLVWVPVTLIPVVALVTALAQIPLARYVRENLRESSLRQGLMVEALSGAETLKALRAEGLVLGRYESASAATSMTAMKSRLLTQVVLNFCAMMQSVATVAMVVWGAYLIGDGELTLGALIGAVILAGRALAPIGSLAGLAVRFQQARSALETLDRVMAQPVDREPGRDYLRLEQPAGALAVRGLAYRYAPDRDPVLQALDWQFGAGERVGLVGRIGSGKSTLLRLLAGLYEPSSGQVLLDGVDLRQLDPADVRRAICYVGQDAWLMHGSLRENLMAGARGASDERLLEVCRATGVDALAAADPRGYDMPLGEGGAGLSGGQRQLVALTRALLCDATVLLLDEPTSAMDNATEQQALAALSRYAEGRGILLVTHKLPLLARVDRLIVLDGGRCVADGPREAVLQALADGRVRAAAAPPQGQAP